MNNETVILVNSNDQPVGVDTKLNVHQTGALHRAFSVFIFNNSGELLLQKRADSKYHSAGLWTNTCCGHPRPDEITADAAKRRLQEEMGFTTHITEAFSFRYEAALDNGLIENEYDHVFLGAYDGPVTPNADEASDWKYMPLAAIAQDIEEHPAEYTYWFKLIFNTVHLFFINEQSLHTK
jgi:isopentenyl-diphosphate Delta-isomerase